MMKFRKKNLSYFKFFLFSDLNLKQQQHGGVRMPQEATNGVVRVLPCASVRFEEISVYLGLFFRGFRGFSKGSNRTRD